MATGLSVKDARRRVAGAARDLAAAGLVRATNGNVSVRAADGIAVTPAGGVLATLAPEDITLVDLTGKILDGGRPPSSELDLHLGAYARPGVGAVVHTHAPAATAVACITDELPVIHYELMALGGAIRVAPWANPGTPQLAAKVLEAMDGRIAALMANHGTLAIGTDLPGALRATETLEWVSDLFLRAAPLGSPTALDAAAQADFVATMNARAQRLRTRAPDAAQ